MLDTIDVVTILLGIYIMAHGGIHLIFLGYFKDEKTNVYTGWSRQSWLLGKIMSDEMVKITGFVTWIIIALFFGISGLIILSILPFNEYLNVLVISVSILAIIAYIVFFNGFGPTPYHWILGVVINGLIIIFYSFFLSEMFMLLVLLILVWAYGMVFHTKVINAIKS